MSISKSIEQIKLIAKIPKLQEFALNHIEEAVYLLDKDAQLKYVNKYTCDYLNYSKDELLTMSIHDLYPDFPPSKWLKYWQEVKKCKNLIVKTKHKTKDGELIPVVVNANYFEYKGTGYYMACIKNITECLNNNETTQNNKNEKTDLFFESQLIGMAIISLEKEWININDKLCDILGYSHQELLGNKCSDIIHPSDMTLHAKQFEHLLNGEIDNYIHKQRFFHKDGSIVYTNISVNCIRKNDKSIESIAAQFEDITLRKKAQEDIKTLNIQLEKHIEQREVQLKEAIESLIISQQEFQDKTNWFELSISKISQNPNHFLTLSRDITSYVQIKEKLKTQEQEFRTLLENSSDVIVRYDCNLKIVYVNPVWEEVNNISIKDVIGKSPSEKQILVEDFVAEYEANLRKVLQSGETMEVELSMRNKENENIYFLQKIIAEFDTDGSINGILSIARNITERKITEKKMEYIAQHDSLTGLPNRLVAKDRAKQAIALAKRNNTKAAIIFLDLDGFKSINDSMGHSMGDSVLKVVASRIKNAIRDIDTISRQGGDEFLIILSDIKSKDDVLNVVEKLLYKFERPFDVETHAVSTSASMGITLYPDHGNTFEQLLQNADSAMYKAKENGKNTYTFFTEQMKHNLKEQFQIRNDLKKAIENNELLLHYQPQINFAKNRISGAEALIRWNHPEFGMVPPIDFIPIAESSGLIVPIGEWVLNEACKQAAFWAKKGIELTIAVNISAVQFKRGNLEKIVKKALFSSGLNPRFLELELTESIMINDVEIMLKSVQTLKDIGVQLSIDDFGTGYSSLAYLKRFAVDKLKIDQSFIRDIINDNEDATIVYTIIQMAKNLNLKTIAEGVENSDVFNVVHALGCDEVQGYHFSKPIKSTEFENFYHTFK